MPPALLAHTGHTLSVATHPASGAAVVDPPRAEHSAPRLFEPAESTLEELILGVWEDLSDRARAECPVCGGVLLPEGCVDCFSVVD